LILGLALSGGALAEPPPTAIIGTPPQPDWLQLSRAQQDILAPLANDWDGLDSIARKQWLGIAERYPAMPAARQQRVQARMHKWAAMTPDQRAQARQFYKNFKQLPEEKKQEIREKWKTYRNLPAEERQRLREKRRATQSAETTSDTAPPAPEAAATTESPR